MFKLSMSIIQKRKFILLLLLVSSLYLNCSKRKITVKQIISTGNFKKAVFANSGEYSSVKIITAFPTQEDCSPSSISASLYVCKDLNFSKDTIYVFDECNKAPSFATDTTIDIGVSIDVQKIKTTIPKAVTIFVPKEFRIPSNAKIVFASLTALLE